MGFFTKKDKVKAPPPPPRPKQKSSNLLEPPNIFVAPGQSHGHALQKAPPRPTTATKDRETRRQHESSRYAYHQRNASTPHLARPAGYLMAPPGRQDHAAPQPHCGPLVVNQNYYINGQQPVAQPTNHQYSLPYGSTGYGRSMGNLLTSTVNVCDDISNRLNHVLTMIDGEHLKGNEMDLFSYRHPVAVQYPSTQIERVSKPAKKSSGDRRSDRDGDRGRDRGRRDRDKERHSDKSRNQATDVATSVVKGNYFSKVELYANSRLHSRDLAPFAVYMPTWPLICLAAQYSLAVYERPSGAESESHVSADWLRGSKAMCIKSVPMDSMHTIVFAIRGTASFMDWAVNLNDAPTPPSNFLDDPGNLCHAGFLTVARRMVKPVASRLRQLLREDPSRSRYSLMITGHSAGGAIASLLYAHMLAETKDAESELNVLTARFRRVHCVTFGTPPLSLIPIQKPDRPELKNSVFLGFINEGDPVTRADKAYVKSLLELLASPVPEPTSQPRKSRSRSRHRSKTTKPVWPIPSSALSNAGRLVVLRSGRRKGDPSGPKDRMTVRERLDEGVIANVCREDQLRGLVWGDPVAHLMKLYAGRVEALAVEAVTASRYS